MSSNIEWPKLTLVTPNLNQGKFLEQTIKSVLDQGYPHLQYIVVDGGSSDNSLDILKNYQSQITVISQKSKGLYTGIQEGFDIAEGEVLGWLNSDDLLIKGALNVVGRIFGQFGAVEWITGVPSLIDDQGDPVMVYPSSRFSRWDVLREKAAFIQQESTFWRRSLWQRAGARFNAELTLAGDFELWMRFFRHARLHTVETSLGQFRVRQDEQKSYTQKPQYEAQKQSVILQEVTGLSAAERTYLARIQKLDSLIEHARKWMPGKILERLEFERTKLLERPFRIIFDRERYQFKFEELL